MVKVPRRSLALNPLDAARAYALAQIDWERPREAVMTKVQHSGGGVTATPLFLRSRRLGQATAAAPTQLQCETGAADPVLRA